MPGSHTSAATPSRIGGRQQDEQHDASPPAVRPGPGSAPSARPSWSSASAGLAVSTTTSSALPSRRRGQVGDSRRPHVGVGSAAPASVVRRARRALGPQNRTARPRTPSSSTRGEPRDARRRRAPAPASATGPAPSATGSRQLGYWSTVPGRLGWRRSPTASPKAARTTPAGRGRRARRAWPAARPRRPPRAAPRPRASPAAPRARPRTRSRSCSTGIPSWPSSSRTRTCSSARKPAAVGRSCVVTLRHRQRAPLAGGTARAAVLVVSVSNHSTALPSTPARSSVVRTRSSTVPRSSPTTSAPARAGLQREHPDHRVGVVRDVGAVRGGRPGRDPPEPEQPHDVVDPQPAGVPEHPPHQLAVRRVASSRSRSGRHGGSPQSWPCWLKESGGAPTVVASARASCRAQASAPAGVDADREVVHDADRHAAPRPRATAASCSSTSSCTQHQNATRSASSSRAAGDRRGVRPAQPLGPVLPAGAVPLGERAEQREVGRARRPSSARKAASASSRCSGQSSSSAASLAVHAGSRVDPLRVGRRAQRGDPVAQVVAAPRVLGDVLDAQPQRRAEPPARRGVRRGVERRHRRLGVQRVGEHDAAALAAVRVTTVRRSA